MKTHFIIINLAVALLVLFPPVYASEFKVVVRAHQGIETAVKQWQPTIDALNEKLPAHNFIMTPILSLNEITKRVGQSEFDFAITNPSSYVELQQLYGAKALVTLNNKRSNTAQNRFGSVIFTKADREDILSIADLDNKTLMAVSEPAFGGWRVAWLEMLEQGFDPKQQLKQLLFTKSKAQPEVVQAVLEGKVDAGVVRTDLLERLEVSGKIDMRYLRILNSKNEPDFPFFLSTKLYPEWPFVAMKSVDKAVAQQVGGVLLTIEKGSTAAMSGKYVGWLPSSDYDVVLKLMERLGVGGFLVQQSVN